MNKQRKRRNPTRCDICGAAGLHTSYISDVYDGLLIQHIPQHHCDNCGETYFTFQTLQAIDEARAHPERYASMQLVISLA